MSHHLIESAWVEDGEIHVKVKRETGGGMNLVLRKSDIDQARKENHISRPVRTEAQKIVFSRVISGKRIPISSLGGSGKPLKAEMKEEIGRKYRMAKSKKVEWKLKGNRKSLDEFQGDMNALVSDIRDIDGVGKSGFKGWVQFKEGDEDKADEVTLVGSFSKSLADHEDFPGICNGITQLLLKGEDGLKLKEFEVKE